MSRPKFQLAAGSKTSNIKKVQDAVKTYSSESFGKLAKVMWPKFDKLNVCIRFCLCNVSLYAKELQFASRFFFLFKRSSHSLNSYTCGVMNMHRLGCELWVRDQLVFVCTESFSAHFWNLSPYKPTSDWTWRSTGCLYDIITEAYQKQRRILMHSLHQNYCTLQFLPWVWRRFFFSLKYSTLLFMVCLIWVNRSVTFAF